MSFQVEWLREAVNEVMDAWEEAGAFQAQPIREATEKIDRLLADDPLQVGESRENIFVRVLTVDLVTVGYRVDRFDSFVTVFVATVHS